jgi:hypothetical protein
MVMFNYFKITHKSGESKLVNIYDFTVPQLDAIREVYDNNPDYEIEEVKILF